MGIVEQYEQMNDWARVVVAAGFECDGRPVKVYELATLILNDTEVNQLLIAYKAGKPLPMDALSDNPAPRPPFESDLVDVLDTMTPQQREALQARVVDKYKNRKEVEE